MRYQLLNVYKIFNLTTFLCSYTTLQTTTRKVQRVFFSRLWVALKAARFCGWVALKRTGCLQQMFKMMPSHLHTCKSRAVHWSTVLSIMLCRMLSHVSMTHCFKLLMSQTGVLQQWLPFVQPLLGNFHANCRALYPFNQYKVLTKTLLSALKTMLTRCCRNAITVRWKMRHFSSEKMK